MKLHKEGLKIIPAAFLVLAVIDAVIYFFLKDFLIFYVLIAASLVMAALIAYFFRVPNRKPDINENHILAPADGKIVAIEPVFEKEYFKEERIQISVFMSPLNVHQNFAPVSGNVIYVKHTPGRFYRAFVAKSSEENERCSTVFRMKNNTEILSRQIAGAVARRIITHKEPDSTIEQGQEYGFIRFGSRVDVFVPKDVKINVKLHQKSVGGKTVLASFS